jgi:hypothetical protein
MRPEPAVSAVLQGSFNMHSHSPAEVISGFPLREDARRDSEGFSLGDTELHVGAAVDSWFRAALTASLEDEKGETDIVVDEAFIETLALPGGFTLKAGRMFPALGYLNEQHAHTDAFADRPLPYRVFFGADNFREDGAQLSLRLPTQINAVIGGGGWRGTAYPTAGSATHGTGAVTVFGRLSGEVGASHAWRTGLSYLMAEALNRTTAGLEFDGTTRIYTADARWVWAPDGDPAQTALTLQSEYFWREEHGDYADVDYREDSEGWYAQAIYRFRPAWQVGYRYARLRPPPVPAAFLGTLLDDAGHTPRAHALVIEWTHSGSSRLRFQYTRDESGPIDDDVAILRYTVGVGAHGAEY